MNLPDGYTIRHATVDDANSLAHFRAGLFQDFGVELEAGWEAFWTAYFTNALQEGRY